MKLRSGRGATLTFVCAILVVLVLIGCAFFALARILGGSRQSINATDAGANAAAKAMLAVSVPASSLPTEFQGLGVNVPPDPTQPALAAGAPDPSANGKYNLFAYNRCAGVTSIIALNALEEYLNGSNPTTTGQDPIAHANAVIASLRAFGDNLNANIRASGQIGSPNSITARDFESVASQNNTNMLSSSPQNHTTLSNDLDFRCVTTGLLGTGGKANVYFNTAVTGSDPFIASKLPFLQDTTGSTLSVAVVNGERFALSYELPKDGFQDGQPLLKGYDKISLGSGIADIYFASVNPPSEPHLIESGRFNNGAPALAYAPVNSVSGQTETRETYKTGSLLSNTACAIVGALYNEYPITFAHGYVRVHNAPDSRIVNAGLQGTWGTFDGSNNIFNNALYPGPGGSGGVYYTNNNCFYTFREAWGTIDGSGQFYRAQDEINAYLIYNSSRGFDPLGRSASLDPADGKEWDAATQARLWRQYQRNNPYRFDPYWPPNGRDPYYSGVGNVPDYGGNGWVPPIRHGAVLHQGATYNQLRNITASSSEIPYRCISTAYGQPGLRPWCATHVGVMEDNYDGAQSGGNAAPPNPTWTNLEAAKAEVGEEWFKATQSDNFSGFSYCTNGNQFRNDSGSKVYDRNIAHANPSNTGGNIAFGTVATPYALLNQLGTTGAGCISVDPRDPRTAALWADTNTIQGKMLQRCKQILPQADANMVSAVLNSYPIDLGQYQYIYLPAGSTSLAMSTTPPAFLNGLPEFRTPGYTKPDGVPIKPLCSRDSDFRSTDTSNSANGPLGNEVDARIGQFGNGRGDLGLHKQPFEDFQGTFDTYDYAVGTPSAGQNDLLYELEFFNHVGVQGCFSSPN